MEKIRKRYDEHKSKDYGFEFKKPSLTQQQFKAECDVNNILAKYKKSGLLTHINKHQGNFGDFTNVEDYKTSLEKVMKAQESFEHLPSELRNKFQNDPGNLISYLQDPKNDEEAVKYGLKYKKEETKPKIEEEKKPSSKQD